MQLADLKIGTIPPAARASRPLNGQRMSLIVRINLKSQHPSIRLDCGDMSTRFPQFKKLG